MEGLFQLLLIAFVLWAWSRGTRGRKPRPPVPRGEADEGQEPELDWDRAIGDVLEGMGMPRPEPKDRRLPGSARVEPAGPRPERLEPRRARPQPRPRRPPARVARPAGDRELLEIAGLAEAAAMRRAEDAWSPARAESRPVVPGRAPPPEPAGPEGSAPPGPRPRASAALPRGMSRLESLSELERAIVYAEILGPPKALEP